ncbi:SGNH hydrolase-type esterase domain-containing protein, partial [Halenospora varia]
ITQGSYNQASGFALGAELQTAYVRRLDVINRGFSGYNTDNALTVLDKILPTPQQARIKFLTVWFGANDCARAKKPLDQNVPIERFRSNLKAIVTHPAVVAHAPNIIFLTQPPIEETMLTDTAHQLGWDTTKVSQVADSQKYANVVKEVGQEEGIVVVDVWSKFMELAGWQEGAILPGAKEGGKNDILSSLLSDGLHLTSKGYKVIFEELLETLKANWPEYPPYKMPYEVKIDWEIAFGDQYWDVNNLSG